MSDAENTMPNVDEIKERLKVEIPVEEEPLKIEVEDETPAGGSNEMVDELSNLGRKFAETLQSAWDSEERAKFEQDVREGVRSFADEVDKVIRDLREGSAGTKLRNEATKVNEQIKGDDITNKARGGIVSGLRWLSVEMGKLADQFTPAEKEASETKDA